MSGDKTSTHAKVQIGTSIRRATIRRYRGNWSDRSRYGAPGDNIVGVDQCSVIHQPAREDEPQANPLFARTCPIRGPLNPANRAGEDRPTPPWFLTDYGSNSLATTPHTIATRRARRRPFGAWRSRPPGAPGGAGRDHMGDARDLPSIGDHPVSNCLSLRGAPALPLERRGPAAQRPGPVVPAQARRRPARFGWHQALFSSARAAGSGAGPAMSGAFVKSSG